MGWTLEQVIREIERAKEKPRSTFSIAGTKPPELPPQIEKLTHLTTLDLSENEFSTLPPEIANLSQLKVLNLANNQFKRFPTAILALKNLENLNLSANCLDELPDEIRELSSLTELNIQGNSSIPLPKSILPENINDSKRILNYYFCEVKKTECRLNQAKIILVGESSVGKTSLVKRLMYNKFNPNESATHGIIIHPWYKKIFGVEKFRINIWDLGGQEIQHTTHKLFLTGKTLYLLVLNARMSAAQNKLYYWLDMIDSFKETSEVIIISNKIDECKPNYQIPKGYETVETSCQIPKNISLLRDLILKKIGGEDKYNSETVPNAWFSVKEALTEMDEHHVAYADYQACCFENGVNNENEQEKLMHRLHDLGIIINFQEDVFLSKTSVLKPDWITHAIYKILDFREIGSSRILQRSEIFAIFDKAANYDEKEKHFIINIMEKLQLCVKTETGGYLVPALLSDKEPKYLEKNWEYKSTLRYRFHYTNLPNSLIEQFIVRASSKIYNQICWLFGVMLEYEYNGQLYHALIEAEMKEKYINIYLTGNAISRKKFLQYINSQLEAIHKELKLNAKPIIVWEGIDVEHEDLYKHRLNGKSDMEVTIASNPSKKEQQVKKIPIGLLDEYPLFARDRESSSTGNENVEEDIQSNTTDDIIDTLPNIENPNKKTSVQKIRNLKALINSLYVNLSVQSKKISSKISLLNINLITAFIGLITVLIALITEIIKI